MSSNVIASLKNVARMSPDGDPFVAIMIALHINDLQGIDTFIAEVAQTFLAHRMISPAETNVLLITIIGGLTAERFARRWRELVEQDALLEFVMSQMKIADVVRGTAAGEWLESVSLLGNPSA